MRKITKHFKSKIRTRLRMYFDLATTEHINNGIEWYRTANNYVDTLHGKYSQFTHEQIAGVISALSPHNKWERNLYDAEQVLQAVAENKSPNDIKVCTFNTNKFKAFAIALGERSIDDSSRKTYSFVRNIAELDPRFVTIDVWHLRACFGKDMGTPTPKQYDEIARITIQEAKKVGLIGYQYQAIIWECIRSRDTLI